MPRLTNKDYLNRHHWLQMMQQREPQIFGVLPFALQQAVHVYYQTTAVLSAPQLLEQRDAIQKKQPALAQRASKAFKRVERLEIATAQKANGDRKLYHEIIVQSVPPRVYSKSPLITYNPWLKPELDFTEILTVLVDAVGKLPKTKRDQLAEETKQLIESMKKEAA